MNQTENDFQEWADKDIQGIDFDALESKLELDLEEQMDNLKDLELDHEKIGSPDSIGDTVMNVVWDQFVNQIGIVAGEDFIKENQGLTLDLRDEAHIQTTENFANGKIAKHNTKINYQKRYDDWQANFQHDKNGNVITHNTRTGKQEATLVTGARAPFDEGRPTGSVEKNTDMDHIVSAGEIIRDPAANAHLSKEEQIAFANSDVNLNEMDAGQNRSKGDLSMTDWLDNPNSKGQKPNEIFDISDEQDKKYREKDAAARAEYENQKKEGEKRSVEAGKQSQKEEAFRIGGKALRSVIMGLLASLIKDIIRKLIAWLRSTEKNLNTFIDSIKTAIKVFISNIKEKLLNAGNTLVTTIATAIFGPVIGMIKKAWIFLKQGYKSVKQAVLFLKDPANKNISFSVKMMEIGKIVITGLTASGSIVLSEVIEKGLMAIPVFAIEIPLIGSLASIIGIFMGALVSGLIGALALNLIDKLISKKLKKINEEQQRNNRNTILSQQGTLMKVKEEGVESTISSTIANMKERHREAADAIKHAAEHIMQNSKHADTEVSQSTEIAEEKSENDSSLNQLFSDINDIK